MSIKLIRYKTREEWLDKRSKIVGIGGSEISSIVKDKDGNTGSNPYSSATELFYIKTGVIKSGVIDNLRMKFGRDFEDTVADYFQYGNNAEEVLRNSELGLKLRKVRRVNAIAINSKYPALFADIDRDIVRVKEGLECKTIKKQYAQTFENGIIPSHIWQCQHYMTVFEYTKMYLAYYYTDVAADECFEVFEIPAIKSLQERLVKDATEFIEERVKPGREIMSRTDLSADERDMMLMDLEPEPDSSDALLEFYNQKYLDNIEHYKNQREYVPEGEDDLLLRSILKHDSIQQNIKKLTDDKKLVGNIIRRKMLQMGDVKKVIIPQWGAATWDTRGSLRITLK